MKPSTAMMSYQNSSIDEDVPIVTSIRPPTMMTTGQRSKQMIAIFAAGMMLVAGVVLMQDGSSYHHLSGSGSITSTAEGLVVAPPKKCGSCYGAGKEGECCNTCDEVKAAYLKKDWGVQDWASIVQCNATQIEEAKAAGQGRFVAKTDDFY